MKRLNLKLVISLVVGTLVMVAGVWIAHAVQQRSTEGNLKKEAEALAQEGKKDEALKKYTAYLQRNENDAEVYVTTAKLAVEIVNSAVVSGMDQKAFVELNRRAYTELVKGVHHNSENVELRKSFAEFLMRNGLFAEALDQLEWLTSPQRGKHEPKFDAMLAACYVQRAYYDKALGIYGKLTGFDPKSNKFDSAKAVAPQDIESYIYLARLMREKLEPAQPKEADAVIEQLVAANKDSFLAHLERSRYLRQYRDSDPAREEERQKLAKEELATALKLAPDDANVILLAAQSAQLDKDFDNSEKLLVRGLKLFPKNVDMYRQRAILKMDQNQTGEARKRIEQGLKLSPKNVYLLSYLAEIELQQHDLEATRGTLKTLAELNYPRELLDLMDARVVFFEQKWLEASKKLERLRAVLPEVDVRMGFRDPNEHTKQADLFLAQCYQQLGQPDKQLEACRRVLSIDPLNVAALVNEASALSSSGKTQEAQRKYEQLGRLMGPKAMVTRDVWVPIIDYRLMEQMKRPAKERDWTQIDRLVDWLEQHGTAGESAVALIKAEVQLRKEDVNGAFKTLDAARVKNPKDPALWTATASVVEKQKDKGPAAAIKILDQAPEEIRDSVALRLERADMIVHQGGDGVKVALAELDAGSDKLSAADRSLLWSRLGTDLLSVGDRDGAIRYWTKVAEANPDDLRIRFSLLDAAREAGDDAIMSNILDDMRRIMGKGSVEAQYVEAARIVAMVRKAVRQRSTGRQSAELESEERLQLAAARKLLAEVSQKRPGWYEVARVTGDAELLDGNVDAAISNYQQALNVGPPNPGTIRTLALLLSQSSRFDELQKAIDLVGPENLDQLGYGRLKADLDANQGKFDEAIERARQEVKDDSRDPGGHMWIGHLYEQASLKKDADPAFRQKMRDEAEASFRRAVKTGPQLTKTWLELIDCLMADKKNREATDVLMEARKELPEDLVNTVLGPGYEALGESVLADQYYRAALEAAPNDLPTHRLVAMYFQRNGRTDDARKEVLAVLRGAQNDPKEKHNLLWARRALAEILAASGEMEDFDRAKALLIANTKVTEDSSEDKLRLANLLAARIDEPVTLHEALKWFQEAEKVKKPLGQQDQMTVARIRDILGDWDFARSEMLKLVSQPDADPNVYRVFVEMLIRHGQVSDADNWLDKLASVQHGAGLLLRTQVLVKQGKPNDAIALLRQILPPRPVAKNRISELRKVALVMDQLGLNQPAEDLYREYMYYNPGTGALQLAAFLGRTGRLDEALDLCETALKAQPRDQVLQVVGEVLRGQPRRLEPQHVERVGKWFDQMLREDPESAALLLQYADFLVIASQDDKAEKLYRDVLTRSDLASSQRAIAFNNLAFVLAGQRKNLPEALELINKAGKLIGFKSDLLDTRGMVYLAMGKYPDAVTDFSDAVLGTYPSAIKLLHLAFAQDLATDRQAARATLQRAKEARLDSAALPKAEQGFYEQLIKDVGL